MFSPKFSTDARRQAFENAKAYARALADLTRPGFTTPAPSRRQIAQIVHAWAGECKRMLGAEV